MFPGTPKHLCSAVIDSRYYHHYSGSHASSASLVGAEKWKNSIDLDAPPTRALPLVFSAPPCCRFWSVHARIWNTLRAIFSRPFRPSPPHVAAHEWTGSASGRYTICLQALASVQTPLGGSVFMVAADSKEPAMVKEVLECVRNHISEQQVGHEADRCVVLVSISLGRRCVCSSA